MKSSRLEAFSDGVIAILVTIMVLEFKTPEGHDRAGRLTGLGATPDVHHGLLTSNLRLL